MGRELGRKLNSYDFKNLQSLDISQKYFEILKDQDIYKALHLEKLGETLSFADNQFDILVSTDVFTHNQVPLESLEELVFLLIIKFL